MSLDGGKISAVKFTAVKNFKPYKPYIQKFVWSTAPRSNQTAAIIVIVVLVLVAIASMLGMIMHCRSVEKDKGLSGKIAPGDDAETNGVQNGADQMPASESVEVLMQRQNNEDGQLVPIDNVVQIENSGEKVELFNLK